MRLLKFFASTIRTRTELGERGGRFSDLCAGALSLIAAVISPCWPPPVATRMSQFDPNRSQLRAALEHCHLDDLPRLTVTRRIDDGANPKFMQRDFSQLSLGQQQSVLLALILSSDSKRPLIIDQPEDNLDSEFIFHTFVPVLRRAKERRQVIIVTHNTNIAVLGDAEQLIVFKSNSDHSVIVARGSIDDKVAQDAACKILEGAREPDDMLCSFGRTFTVNSAAFPMV
jgi:AAA domain, putative AbiEii toxin, Type IV TA system